ncbi:hypothetical protein NDK43_21550 [Neobacillus pocheonensis]|uniref:Uncharacterized protein n=1 Tax=Neobacillus pocheonensis TaxID=363869 RepID=A0ABT0WDW2_9BACI|nr:hypothetical protein [Neobacillus pocheonensis]
MEKATNDHSHAQKRDSKTIVRLIEVVSKRSVLVLMSILLIMLWGGFSAYQMQRDYMPAINDSTLMITVRA